MVPPIPQAQVLSMTTGWIQLYTLYWVLSPVFKGHCFTWFLYKGLFRTGSCAWFLKSFKIVTFWINYFRKQKINCDVIITFLLIYCSYNTKEFFFFLDKINKYFFLFSSYYILKLICACNWIKAGVRWWFSALYISACERWAQYCDQKVISAAGPPFAFAGSSV